jgi:ketopantoate reductase
MRVAILGAGAIEGYYGALLAKTGEEVVFVARGAHLQAFNSHGLSVKTANAESTVPVTAVGHTDAVGPVDLVLFCVKSNSCAEVEAVARAEGIHLGSDAVERMLTQAGSLAPQWQSSMARDLEVGRRLEVEALSGAVVRRGRKYDIPTPVHQAIWASLAVHHP